MAERLRQQRLQEDSDLELAKEALGAWVVSKYLCIDDLLFQ
jgi:hypothetical protein